MLISRSAVQSLAGVVAASIVMVACGSGGSVPAGGTGGTPAPEGALSHPVQIPGAQSAVASSATAGADAPQGTRAQAGVEPAAPAEAAGRGDVPSPTNETAAALTPAERLAPSGSTSPPAAPTLREVIVPAGTPLTARLTSAVSSEGRVEEPVTAVVTKPVVVSGVTVVPEGAELTGTIVDTKRSGRVKGRATVAFRFDSLLARGTRHQVRTDRITRAAAATKGADAKKIGIGAGAGAVLGAITGGKKGSAIGGAVGAGGGTGVVLATRGKEVHVPVGTVVSTRLVSALTVQVPNR